MDKKRILYTGLKAPENTENTSYIHLPLIEIVPLADIFIEKKASHLIFTSKSAVLLFHTIIEKNRYFFFYELPTIAVGKKTKEYLESLGFIHVICPEEETQEGIIALIKKEYLNAAHFFWPRSQLSREVLFQFLQKFYKITAPALYTTITKKGTYPLEEVDAIFFSSPSTVRGFIDNFGSIPKNKELITQGSITQGFLDTFLLCTS